MRYLATLLLTCAITVNGFAQFCTNDNRFTEIEYFEMNELTSELDVVYGSALDYQGNSTTLLLDIIYPSGSADALTERPAVMMIHGGGFLSGNKVDRRNECIAFAKRGYVAFSISYRLGWDTQEPTDQILAYYRATQDAKAAMRFIVENSANYGIDTDWLFVGGSSAGAFTSFGLAYSQENEWNLAYPGIVSSLGNLNTSSNSLTNSFEVQGIFNNWGAVNPILVQQNEMLPMISFHGELDATVDIDVATGGSLGSRAFHNELVANGVCSDLSIDTDGGHGIYLGPEGAIFRAAKASCFFKSVFCDDCSTISTTDSIPANCSTISSVLDEQGLSNPIVYPNPFSDRITVKSNSSLQTFMLHDAQGKLIYSGSDISNEDFSSLPSGIYLLEILEEAERFTVRLIKD